MLTKESIYVILFALPVYQLLFYTVQLVSLRRGNPSKKYLGFLLLSMTSFLVINAIDLLGYQKTFSWFYFIYHPLLLGIAPSYFLYILSITTENHDVDKRQRLILFSPAFLLLLVNLILFFSIGRSGWGDMLERQVFNSATEGGNYSMILSGLWIAVTVLVFGQLFFAISKVIRIMQIEADTMRIRPSHLAYLNWKWIIGISLSVLIFIIINTLSEMILPVNQLGLVVVYNILMLLSGGITGYFGMKQDQLLTQVEKINTAGISMDAIPVKEEIDAGEQISAEFISKEETERILKMTRDYLAKDKPYLNPDFSMHDLCDHLNISRRKMSYVMNEVIRKNFYGVINEYRINEARELLKNEQNSLKIEALGELVGFRSKSSFNACFKKMTGITPSEFRMKK